MRVGGARGLDWTERLPVRFEWLAARSSAPKEV